MTANSDTSWIPRYLTATDVATATLDEIPHLVRMAWDWALHFPETGGEGIEDLIEDLKEIVEREKTRLSDPAHVKAEARRAALDAANAVREKNADEERRLQWLQREAYEAITGLTVATVAKGMSPRGCFVYMLWERKGAEKPIYVGKSTNIFARIGDHMRDPARRKRIGWVTFIRCEDTDRMKRAERKWIGHYKPELNIQGIEAGDLSVADCSDISH